jgi:formylglycine-generating enzyme
MIKLSTFLKFSCLVLLSAAAARAVTIDLVTVGNPGNAPDTAVMSYDGTTGYGRVDYAYQIGKYEVTNAQWCEFLNAKASVSDPYGLYNTNMAGDYGGIIRTQTGSGTESDPYRYHYSYKNDDANWANRPVNWVSIYDAVRFCNWLTNGQGDGDTENGSYHGGRQPGAKYVLPTENEWYKAAYYDPNKPSGAGYWLYPTKTTDNIPSNVLSNPDPGNSANFWNSLPHGDTLGPPYYTTVVGEFENSPGPYGTFDQGGNIAEWNETMTDGFFMRGVRGGSFAFTYASLASTNRGNDSPTYEIYSIGFRVAYVPEPGIFILALSAAIVFISSRAKHWMHNFRIF